MDYAAMLEALTGLKLDIEIKTEAELVNFIKNPSKYLHDEESIEKIKSLKDILDYMTG